MNSKKKGFEIIHMDEYADALLTQEAYLDIVLTRIPKRMVVINLKKFVLFIIFVKKGV